MTENSFVYADRSIKTIQREMEREFQSFSRELGFDEMNILETRKRVHAMYKRLNDIVRREYRRIARKAYRETCMECGKDMDDLEVYLFIDHVLSAYDPLSNYIFSREWTRKRDRLFESVIATQRGNQEMRTILKRGMNLLLNQVRQYADNVTVAAALKSYSDTGTEYVQWITMEDNRVCNECDSHHLVIYPLQELPPMPAHYRCRCYVRRSSRAAYEAQQRGRN